MYRGTTPTFTFTLPETVDLTEADSVYVTFAEMDETLIYTKTGEELSIEEHSVEVYLTQEETLALPDGRVKVQLNWLYEEGTLLKRACSNIITIDANKNLLDEVLE